MSGKRKEPMRKCIGCGEMKGKKTLIRQKGLERSFQAAIPCEVYDSLRKELAELDAE